MTHATFQLGAWLGELGLPQYEADFRNHACNTLETISTLTDEELREIGVSKLGHRKTLRLGIGQLLEQRVENGIASSQKDMSFSSDAELDSVKPISVKRTIKSIDTTRSPTSPPFATFTSPTSPEPQRVFSDPVIQQKKMRKQPSRSPPSSNSHSNTGHVMGDVTPTKKRSSMLTLARSLSPSLSLALSPQRDRRDTKDHYEPVEATTRPKSASRMSPAHTPPSARSPPSATIMSSFKATPLRRRTSTLRSLKGQFEPMLPKQMPDLAKRWQEGYLSKKSVAGLQSKLQGWQKRYYVLDLQEKMLRYWKGQEDYFDQCPPHGERSLVDMRSLLVDKQNVNNFVVVYFNEVDSKEHAIHLKADSIVSSSEWTLCLSSLLNQDAVVPFPYDGDSSVSVSVSTSHVSHSPSQSVASQASWHRNHSRPQVPGMAEDTQSTMSVASAISHDSGGYSNSWTGSSSQLKEPVHAARPASTLRFYEGFLDLKQHRRWLKRYFVLNVRTGVLYYFATKKDAKLYLYKTRKGDRHEAMTYSGGPDDGLDSEPFVLDLNGFEAAVEARPSIESTFRFSVFGLETSKGLSPARKEWMLRAPSGDAAGSWLDAVRRCLKQSSGRTTTERTELSAASAGWWSGESQDTTADSMSQDLPYADSTVSENYSMAYASEEEESPRRRWNAKRLGSSPMDLHTPPPPPPPPIPSDMNDGSNALPPPPPDDPPPTHDDSSDEDSEEDEPLPPALPSAPKWLPTSPHASFSNRPSLPHTPPPGLLPPSGSFRAAHPRTPDTGKSPQKVCGDFQSPGPVDYAGSICRACGAAKRDHAEQQKRNVPSTHTSAIACCSNFAARAGVTVWNGLKCTECGWAKKDH